MKASSALSSSPSLSSYGDDSDQFAETAVKVREDFSTQLKLIASDDNRAEISPSPTDVKTSTDNQDQLRSQFHEAEDEDEEEKYDDFSFVSYIADSSQISADDFFDNGQIRPIFPLFNRDLIFADEDSENSHSPLPMRPAVEKAFIEAPPHPSSSSLSETDESDGIATGPYCVWSKKDTEGSSEVCKKSNSTGFSKIWRFREYRNRSNSDGRDAFVFLNNSTTAMPASTKREVKIVEKSDGRSEKTVIESSSEKKTSGDVKVNPTGAKVKAKRGVKSQTASLSAHEIYLRNRWNEDNRRRSYLPYRPELMGFFTNVHGGLTRNVHPF